MFLSNKGNVDFETIFKFFFFILLGILIGIVFMNISGGNYKAKYETCNNDYSDLSYLYSNLQGNHNSLQSSYSSLQSRYGSLERSYNSQQEQCTTLANECKTLTQQYQQCTQSLNDNSLTNSILGIIGNLIFG